MNWNENSTGNVRASHVFHEIEGKTNVLRQTVLKNIYKVGSYASSLKIFWWYEISGISFIGSTRVSSRLLPRPYPVAVPTHYWNILWIFGRYTYSHWTSYMPNCNFEETLRCCSVLAIFLRNTATIIWGCWSAPFKNILVEFS